jgi:hypothetical protein
VHAEESGTVVAVYCTAGRAAQAGELLVALRASTGGGH